jgi:tRNA(Ile)-lysidine synthase
MATWVEQIGTTIRARKLFGNGDRILLAVSGGLDSMVLLRVLVRLAVKNAWQLVVAHFNHQLRGAESDADERFVQEKARDLGLECILGSNNVRQHQAATGRSVEMVARELRHRFLAASAIQQRCSSIALAHHADDQVELFFLRLLRGTGGEGLSGMKWINSSPQNTAIRLVRPLLDQPKSALEAFAAREAIAYRQDSSNAKLDFPRNRVRHELLPLLARHYQPALFETIGRLMEILGAEAEYVTAAARRWQRAKSSKDFSRLPLAVQRQVIRLQVLGLGIEPTFHLIEHLRGKPGQSVAVSPGLALRRDARGRLTCQKLLPPGILTPVRRPNGSPAAASPQIARIELTARAGKIQFDGLTIRWQRIRRRPASLPKWSAGSEYFDANRLGKTIRLRYWRAGDRFQPSGLPGLAKLQDLFTNLKVPRDQRHQRVIGETNQGEVFWVEGLRIAERFKLDKKTIWCLKWTWNRE